MTANATQLQYVKRSVNTAGGFSICQCHHRAGGDNSDVPIPHGLGAIPDMVIIKVLDGGDAMVVHKYQTSNSTLNNKALVLNSGGVEGTPGTMGSASTAYHTYTTANSAHDHNDADQKIMVYSWKAVAGVSHFGTYEGTGTGSTMTETGLGGSSPFTPSYLLIKNIEGADNWVITDKWRGFGTSGSTDGVWNYANLDHAENASSPGITVGSGQFAMLTTNSNINASGNTYIYMAFA